MNILKNIMAVFAWLGMVIGGMFGGQKEKSVRRFGVPTLATGFAIGWNGFQWKDLAFLLLIPILVMGYGDKSIIGNLVGHIDWLVRLIYSFLLSLPFLFFGLTRWIISAILLIVAFQIHAGSLGHTNWFGDFLVEDILRYGALATAVLLCVIWRNK